MSVTLIWRSDAHNSDQPPQSRKDDWATAILDKLAQISKLAETHKANGVIDGGDLFHIKSPLRNSHELVQRVATVHQDYPCPVWATVGNHDVRHGSLDNIGEAPLGVLFAAGVIKPLYLPEHEAIFVRDGIKVRVVGIPYHGTDYDMNRFTSITKKDEDYLVVIAHVLASNNPMEGFPGEDVVHYQDLANLDPDVWCFGHWHKNQGIKTIGKKIFVNLGSLSRGALILDDLNRTPSVAVLDFSSSGIRVKEVPLYVTPAEEIFDLHKKAVEEENTEVMEDFVANLQQTLKCTDSTSLLEEVRNADIPPEVKERAIFYLEKAGAR